MERPKRCTRSPIIFSSASTDGSRTRLACWRWRLAIANFKDCFGGTPKPTRETRALPRRDQRKIRVDFFRNIGCKTAFQFQHGSEGNHRRIIRAQPGLSTFEFKSFLLAGVAKLSSQFLIATDAAAHRDKNDIVLLRGRDCLAHKDIDNRLLKRRAEICQEFVVLS